MNKKILYAFFAVVAIIMFIIFLFGRESVKIKPQPALQEVNQGQKEELEQSDAAPGYTQNIPSAVNNTPGITIIKKPAFDKKLSLTAGQVDSSKIEKDEILETTTERSREPDQSQYSSGEGINESSINPSPGVIKLNKRPTEEESREMNARGIILY